MAFINSKQQEQYSHEKQMHLLNEMENTLQELQQELIEKSVKTHELQLDLALQYHPVTTKKALEVKRECEKCTKYLQEDGEQKA